MFGQPQLKVEEGQVWEIVNDRGYCGVERDTITILRKQGPYVYYEFRNRYGIEIKKEMNIKFISGDWKKIN